MAVKTIVILGAGFGGLTLANELLASLTEETRIVLIDRKDTFSFGFSNLWVMAGTRTVEESRVSLKGLSKKGIEFVKEEIVRIEPSRNKVKTSKSEFSYDYLVIALGAEANPQLINGHENAFNLYDLNGAADLNWKLKSFEGGKIAIVISRVPYKCPPAPYEAAFLLEEYIRNRGLKEKTAIDVYIPEQLPLTVAGPEIGNLLVGMLKERGIGFKGGVKLQEISGRELKFESETADADLIVLVPPHTSPRVIIESGLGNQAGWIEVDRSLATNKYPNVYAIGDVNMIKLANGLALPKGGVFAEKEARVAARNILSDIKEEFDGVAHCFLEVGEGKAAYAEGRFFDEPNPKVTISETDPKWLLEKKKEEADRIEYWL